jgi:phosphoserine phosphatase
VTAYPVIAFDLDGTLLRGTSVSLMLAEWLGRKGEIAELVRAVDAGEIASRVIPETSASWFAGRHTTDVWRVLEKGPWIVGIADTLQALRASGASVLLATITWRFAAEMLREPHGLAAVSGTEMHAANGLLSGAVSRYFDEHDKARFVERWCAENGYSMSQVAAVGDSRSDVPLFRRVGLSVALNATPAAREAATHVLDTEDLRDVLDLLQPSTTFRLT